MPRVQWDKQKLQTFLDVRRNAIVATVQKDGTPHLTPVSFNWDGEVLTFSMPAGRDKERHLKRDPRVTVLIDEPVGPPPTWVSIKGRAVLERRPEVMMEVLRRTRQKHARPGGPPETSIDTLRQEGRVLVVVKPERLVVWESYPQYPQVRPTR